ncbi:hypothetical protein CEXT_792981 [Caerostris extrusa]|uniref:Uncharacterized protein n=1 Tax=Caerostris extrusa TaxID=172846 RepID=A0AAV4T0R9_CAEEX|nr:hypothetical protein CEXT_792981 [Caerostris extrusa]
MAKTIVNNQNHIERQAWKWIGDAMLRYVSSSIKRGFCSYIVSPRLNWLIFISCLITAPMQDTELHDQHGHPHWKKVRFRLWKFIVSSRIQAFAAATRSSATNVRRFCMAWDHNRFFLKVSMSEDSIDCIILYCVEFQQWLLKESAAYREFPN